jgi:hypothetical protein
MHPGPNESNHKKRRSFSTALDRGLHLPHLHYRCPFVPGSNRGKTQGDHPVAQKEQL